MVERIRNKLAEIKGRLAEIYATKDEVESRERAQLRDEQAAFEKINAQLHEEQAKKLEAVNNEGGEERKRLQEKWRKRIARFSTLVSRAKERSEQQSQNQIKILEEQQRATHVEKTHGNDAKVVEFKQKCTDESAVLVEIEAAATARKQHILAFMREYGITVESAEPSAIEPETVAGQFDRIEDRLEENQELLDGARQRLKRLIPPMLAYTMIFAAHALGGIYVHTTYHNLIYTLIVGASLVILMPIAYSIYNSRNGEALAAGLEMLAHLGATGVLIEQQKQLMKEQQEKGLAALDGERIQRICETYEKLEHQVREVNRIRAETLADLESRKSNLSTRVAQRRKDETTVSEQSQKKRTTDLRTTYDKRIADTTAKYNARKAAIQKESATTVDKLAAEWNSIITGLGAFCEEERKRVYRNPPGPDGEVILPTTFSSEVQVGDVTLDLRDLGVRCDTEGRFSIPPEISKMALPVALSFPMNGCLLLRASPYLRKRAIETLFGAVVRLLSSFPPAKAKMTIIDPVGLGQNFAALMHLADYDESLVNGRIWSDQVQIERKLTELTEHMEKVIQKYLRNRYATIDEYNREAGELAEPYRFLVVADFPTGFSEVAVERLSAIMNSGVRCGVYTLLLHDSRQKFPPPLDETQMRRNGVVIVETGNGLSIDDESLARPLLAVEEPPAPAFIDNLINAIGKQCREAGRVQVPFEVIAPKPEKFWMESSEGGVRVPLGKTGADRLQYLDLGRGTAQHALIAGKTGSGKSNMVHVIITSAAMWYSPKEVEFYLIDFKKGVEFKTYATNRLSHVRVVAIESDREFGLSVLRRIDKELTRRGELFRRSRVQDFAGYRKSADAEQLPRTMLIIDEFQEFFVDDDEVAQDAALLLDRIVRQGRAFGIHVILGSQTLGGTYTLSKSTLGQMAVRIALQCNEADSYLILNDDNSAAALLSRPGEAIYNDQSGQVEGNNPFQAVFLPRDGQEPYLRSLRAKSVESGMENVGTVAIFEGNSLADLRANPVLREAVAKQPVAGADDHVWLGEANAIKGPTEVVFARQAGSNLLAVGHRGGSEVPMCCAMLMSIAANNSPKDVHIRILDGTAADSGGRDRLMAVKNALPFDIEIVEARNAAKTIEEIAGVLKTRQDGDASSGKYYLMILGIDKFRMLRQDDEFSFSSSEDSGAVAPSKAFGDILVEGPSYGIHSIVWCDTLGNLNRTFSRKTLREFESRVLFQMSATDSSELIDSPAANRLGLYNAMLYSVQTGGTEKFRPYSLPDMDLIEELGKNLSARSRLAQNDPGTRQPR
jgi:S-DNA-T family DNA segregation ATPase FtsK/SpoIIIE